MMTLPRKRAKNNHGLRKHPLYTVWLGMRNRCYDTSNDSYKFYGARGIGVCDRWVHDAKMFIDDMMSGYEKGLQLDRKDADKNYSPENCRWVTVKQNAATRRKGNRYTVRRIK